jgi:hypothetical protein
MNVTGSTLAGDYRYNDPDAGFQGGPDQCRPCDRAYGAALSQGVVDYQNMLWHNGFR